MKLFGILMLIVAASAFAFAAIAPVEEMAVASTTIASALPSLAPCPGFGRVNIGQTVDSNGYKVRLADLAVAEGSQNLHAAIVDIMDANGTVLEQAKIDPNGKYVYSGASGKIMISVCQTAAGFTLNSKWAKMKFSTTNTGATRSCAGYTTLDIGETLDNGNFKVRLADLGLEEGAANEHPAILEMFDQSGVLMGKIKLGEKDSYIFTTPEAGAASVASPPVNTMITVCETAPGFTLNAKWAKVMVSTTTRKVTPTCQDYTDVDLGQNLSLGAYTARLADIAVATGSGSTHPAVVEILDANNTIVDDVSLVGQSYTYSSPSGQKYTLSVCQTAPGFTLNAKWAKMKFAIGERKSNLPEVQ